MSTILPAVHIADPKTFDSKRNTIRKDGKQRLHLLTDFDHTLTQASIPGEKNITSWAVFEELLSASYQSERRALHDKYHPIENQPSLPLDFRSKLMREWWAAHLRLLKSENLTREILQRALAQNTLSLRGGARDLLESCSTYEIPVLVLSAGIGDVIKMFLESLALLTPNLHVTSNFLKFSPEGTVIGFESDIVHALNKDQSHVKNDDFCETIGQRPNIILIGDNTGDASMDLNGPDPVDKKKPGTTLRIGYLNEHTANFEAFAKVFDVVITDPHATTDFVHDLIVTM